MIPLPIVDWMTATAAEKLLATNDADPMVYVHVLYPFRLTA